MSSGLTSLESVIGEGDGGDTGGWRFTGPDEFTVPVSFGEDAH